MKHQQAFEYIIRYSQKLPIESGYC